MSDIRSFIKWLSKLGKLAEELPSDPSFSPSDEPRLWINTTDGKLKYYDGVSIKTISDDAVGLTEGAHALIDHESLPGVLSTAEHASIDHAGLPGVGGGAQSGERNRIYLPLQSAVDETTLLQLTGATDPNLELFTDGALGDFVRIKWTSFTTKAVFHFGIPFNDIDPSATLLIRFFATLRTLSGIETGVSVDLGLDTDGGGSRVTSVVGEWPSSGVSRGTQFASISIGPSPVLTDIRSGMVAFGPSSVASGTYALEALWIEYDLK